MEEGRLDLSERRLVVVCGVGEAESLLFSDGGKQAVD